MTKNTLRRYVDTNGFDFKENDVKDFIDVLDYTEYYTSGIEAWIRTKISQRTTDDAARIKVAKNYAHEL